MFSLKCHGNQAHPNHTSNIRQLISKPHSTRKDYVTGGTSFHHQRWAMSPSRRDWASASNSFPASPSSPSSSEGVCGRQRTHWTHLKPEPQLSGPGPPKQWCNTQQAYVTNLCWQLLSLKHRRWRPWERSQEKLVKTHIHTTQWMDHI